MKKMRSASSTMMNTGRPWRRKRIFGMRSLRRQSSGRLSDSSANGGSDFSSRSAVVMPSVMIVLSSSYFFGAQSGTSLSSVQPSLTPSAVFHARVSIWNGMMWRSYGNESLKLSEKACTDTLNASCTDTHAVFGLNCTQHLLYSSSGAPT